MKLIKQTLKNLGLFAVALSVFTSCLPKHDIPPSDAPQPVDPDNPNNPNNPPNNGGQQNVPSIVHLMIGSPTDVSLSPNTDKDNYYIEKPQYAMSYNNSRGTANWVAWHLDDTYIGSSGRTNDWHAENLPAGFTNIGRNDYKRSGFDRGHMCPSADRTNSTADNKSTFSMANVIPQNADNNQGPWLRLEEYCRTLVGQGKELYIYSGVYGTGGEDFSGTLTNTIFGGKVTVPSNTWKVVLVLDKGDNDIARVDQNTTIIAVDMPNKAGIRSTNWKSFGTTVDDIESKSNVDLFQMLSTDLQAKLESKKYQ